MRRPPQYGQPGRKESPEASISLDLIKTILRKVEDMMGMLVRSIAGVSMTDITEEVIVFPIEFVDPTTVLLRAQPTPSTQPGQRYVVEVKVDLGLTRETLPLQAITWTASHVASKTVLNIPFSLESIPDPNAIEGFVSEVFLDAAIADIWVGNATTVMGTPTASTITMNVPAAGLSGYTMNLEVSDPSIAKFVGVSLSSDFPLNSIDPDPVNGPIVTISAVDLADVVTANESGVILAAVAIEPLSVGRSSITAVVTRLDDDKGNVLRAVIEQGLITVNP